MDNSTKVSVDVGATNTAKGVLSAAIKDFGDFWKSASGGSDAKGAAASFENLGSKLDLTRSKASLVAGVAGGLLVAGVLAVGAAAVKTAADFQQMTTTLVTTAGESENNIGMVRDGILKLSSETGTAADQMSTAMYTIESAGFRASDGLNILKAAAQGAKTENADLQKVADAVTSSMIDYHLPASAAADVTSKLVAAVGSGKATFEGFTGALHSVLPVASAAHVSLNDVLGDLASMTVHGMSADQASQNLAESIRKMQSPTASMQQYLAGLGINAADLGTKLGKEGLSGTLEDISNAIMNKMGPSGKVLIDSFNQSKSAAQDAKAMIASMPQSVQALANNFANGTISLADFHKEVKALPATQANLLIQFASLENKAQGFNQQLKNGSPASKTYAQALQAATGDATTFNTALMLTGENAGYTANAVKTVGKAHAEAGGNVSGWAFVQKNMNQQLAEAKQSVTNAGIALGTALLPMVTAVMKAIVAVVLPLSEWISAHKNLSATILGTIGVVGSIIVSIVLMAKAIETVKMAMILLNTTFLTNPITLAIMAIIIATVLLVTHWEAVKNWFKNFWSWLKNLWGDAGSFLYNVGKDMIQGLINGIVNMGGPAGAAIAGIGNSLVKGIKSLLGIHSPSTVFAEIGKNMGAGLIQGIDGVKARATVAVTGLVTGSNMVSNNGAPANGAGNVSNSVTNNNIAGATAHNTINVSLSTGAAVQEFFRHLNQDSLNVGRGAAPVQGSYSS